MAIYNRNATGLRNIVKTAYNSIFSLQVNGLSTNALIVFGSKSFPLTYPTGAQDGGDITSLFASNSYDMDVYFIRDGKEYSFNQFPSPGGLTEGTNPASFTGVSGLTSQLNTIIGNYTKVNFLGISASGNFGALEQSMQVTLGRLNNVILTMNVIKIPNINSVDVESKTLTLSTSTLRTSDANAPSYIFKGNSDFATGTDDLDSADTTIINGSVMDSSTLSTVGEISNVTVQANLQNSILTKMTSFN